MDYSNPKIPEGINSSQENPLKEFSLLLAGIGLLIVILFSLLALTADFIAPHIPFSVERQVANQYTENRPDKTEPSAEAKQINRYLQQLADQIRLKLSLPEEMPITVHYSEDESINAFATLGGHIVIFKGLLERVPDENVLVMVMAHEIAHIKHRDPIRGMGRAIIFGLAISSLSMTVGNQIIDQFLSSSGMLTMLHFSREQEMQADEGALAVLEQLYGHINGATELFRILNNEQSKEVIKSPEFLSTHPENQHRIERIKTIAISEGWSTEGVRSPLPDAVQQLLND